MNRNRGRQWAKHSGYLVTAESNSTEEEKGHVFDETELIISVDFKSAHFTKRPKESY